MKPIFILKTFYHSSFWFDFVSEIFLRYARISTSTFLYFLQLFMSSCADYDVRFCFRCYFFSNIQIDFIGNYLKIQAMNGHYFITALQTYMYRLFKFKIFLSFHSNHHNSRLSVLAIIGNLHCHPPSHCIILLQSPTFFSMCFCFLLFSSSFYRVSHRSCHFPFLPFIFLDF